MLVGMSEDPLDLLDRALKLSVEQRAMLAAELTASLDPREAEQDESAWLATIQRRIKEVQDGTAQTSDWDSVEARILERLRARRA